MLSVKFYNVGSSSDSQENNILEIYMISIQINGYVICILNNIHIMWDKTYKRSTMTIHLSIMFQWLTASLYRR